MKTKGLFTALVTPFTRGNHIDYTALEKLIQFQIKNGVDGIVIAGSTGEASSLNAIEYRKLIQFAHRKIENRVFLIVGVTNNNTDQVLGNIAIAREEGADAILVATPYYNRPSQRGLYDHFATIATHTDLPIVLYNVPSRTACNLENETIIRLADNFENIVAIKEASGDMQKITDLIQHKPEGFVVLSGDDALSLPLIVMGAEGCVSVVSNLIPQEFSLLIHEALKGNFHLSRRMHFHYLNLMQMMFLDTNPSPVKAGLEQIGFIRNVLRSPLVILESKDYNTIGKEIRSLGLADFEEINELELVDFIPSLN